MNLGTEKYLESLNIGNGKKGYTIRFGLMYQNRHTPTHHFRNLKITFSYNYTETRKKIYRILLYLAVDQAKYTPPAALAE